MVAPPFEPPSAIQPQCRDKPGFAEARSGHAQSGAGSVPLLGERARGLSLPAPAGGVVGEYGYFLATPSVVEFTEYDVDDTYRQEK